MQIHNSFWVVTFWLDMVSEQRSHPHFWLPFYPSNSLLPLLCIYVDWHICLLPTQIPHLLIEEPHSFLPALSSEDEADVDSIIHQFGLREQKWFFLDLCQTWCGSPNKLVKLNVGAVSWCIETKHGKHWHYCD